MIDLDHTGRGHQQMCKKERGVALGATSKEEIQGACSKCRTKEELSFLLALCLL